MFHLNGAWKKFQHHHFRQCRFFIYHWNLTFIQFSTRYDCLSLIRFYFDVIFFCCFVHVCFRLDFLYANPISFSQYLTVCVTIVNTSFCAICFTSDIFFVSFLFETDIVFSFLSCRLLSSSILSFLTVTFHLYLHYVLETANREQRIYFTQIHCWLQYWMNWKILSIFSVVFFVPCCL